MNMPNKLTVEIFRDVATKEVSTEAAEAGVETLRALVPELEIIKTSRLLRVAPGSTHVDTRKVRWPNSGADINIVMSGRHLDSEGRTDGLVRMGVATVTRRTRFAFIDATTDDAGLIVAHEGAHLLDVKNRGAFHHDGHCTCDGCIMLPSYEPVRQQPEEERHTQRLYRRFFGEDRKTNAARAKRFEGTKAQFCGECEEQLAINAFYLIGQKNGRTAPPGILGA